MQSLTYVDAPCDTWCHVVQSKSVWTLTRIFPDANCLRPTRAVCAEIHESCMEGGDGLDMELLREQHKADLRMQAA